MSEAKPFDDGWHERLQLLDGSPALIAAALGLSAQPGLDTIYGARIEMADPGPDGTGSPTEPAQLAPIEALLAGVARALSMVAVGRVRQLGTSQLTWYGPPDLERDLEDAILVAFDDCCDTTGVETLSADDPDWELYREVLLPPE